METLLDQYNPHWNKRASYNLIPRSQYCDQIMSIVERREIIVLKGIRRSGKSSLLKLATNELMGKGVPPKNILFMNLEDYRFGSDKNLDTLEKIYQTYHNKTNPQGRVYILLDEIQEIPKFEKWLRTYYEQNESLKFIITGSSSSLFSTELATLLTGRQISLEVFPFSFAEFLAYRAKGVLEEIQQMEIDNLYLSTIFEDTEPLVKRYMREGGFPEMLKNEQFESNVLALQQYISDIILRDIAQRYNIRKIEALQKLALYLIANTGSYINVSRIAQLVGSNRTTILELMAYLREVYMIFTTTSFSFSITEQLNTTKPKKVYCIDNGFYTAIKTDSTKEYAKMIRNTVFQRLRFQWGQELFYWKDKVEIDFVLKDGFPLAVTVSDDDIEQSVNKLLHYLNRCNLPRGILIAWNRLQILEENEHTILMIPLWIFLTKSQAEIMAYGL